MLSAVNWDWLSVSKTFFWLLTGGTYIALFVVLLVDFVGLEKLSSASGLAIMCLGMFNVPLPSIIGQSWSFRNLASVSPWSTLHPVFHSTSKRNVSTEPRLCFFFRRHKRRHRVIQNGIRHVGMHHYCSWTELQFGTHCQEIRGAEGSQTGHADRQSNLQTTCNKILNSQV